jgi:HAE1 family hydrophobic/amphiphilic exporter-1
MENDVYSQIGLIMLMGLAAKNAILIVEFAKAEFEKGKPIVEAALTAARIRFRPILMTAFAFILGVAPLVVSSGAGAASRHILGTAVIGGMAAVSLIAIFLIPVTFYVVEKFAHQGEEPSRPTAQAPAASALPGDGRRLSPISQPQGVPTQSRGTGDH